MIFFTRNDNYFLQKVGPIPRNIFQLSILKVTKIQKYFLIANVTLCQLYSTIFFSQDRNEKFALNVSNFYHHRFGLKPSFEFDIDDINENKWQDFLLLIWISIYVTKKNDY